MTTCLGKSFSLLSVYLFSYFPFGFEGRMWDLIVSVPDHCLSFYFPPNESTSRAIEIQSIHNIENGQFSNDDEGSYPYAQQANGHSDYRITGRMSETVNARMR